MKAQTISASLYVQYYGELSGLFLSGEKASSQLREADLLSCDKTLNQWDGLLPLEYRHQSARLIGLNIRQTSGGVRDEY